MEFVVAWTDLGTAEPRLIIAMIPLSRYVNGSRSLPWMSATMLWAAHRPACNATDPSAGRSTVAVDGVGHVADRVHPWVALGSEVGEGIEATAEEMVGSPELAVSADGFVPPAHTTARVRSETVVEHDTVRLRDFLDPPLEQELDTDSLSLRAA